MHFFVLSHAHKLAENVSGNDTDCPDGNHFIWSVFMQCIATELEWTSFAVGMLSIALWLGVLLPQIVENFKDMRGVGSIALGLLISWILGDATNLVGAILTKQGLIQVLLGVWFVITDLILSIQVFAYHFVIKRRLKNSRGTVVRCVMGLACLAMTSSLLGSPSSSDTLLHMQGRGPGRTLLAAESLKSAPSFLRTAKDISGYTLGITSTVAYFASRTFQIYKNYNERNVHGLTKVTFLMAVLGNLFYGLAIVLYSVEANYLYGHAPWLVGSWGIMILDLTIVYQIVQYGKTPAPYSVQSLDVSSSDSEDEPLLNGRPNGGYSGVLA